MDVGNPGSTPQLTYGNVALAFSFILFDTSVSTFFGLGVGGSIVTAAIRCVVQLSLVALVLKKVFEANNPWAVAGITCLLNIMGTTETVINKSKRRYNYMFPTVLASMLCSTIPVSIVGIRLAMGINRFWKPEQYIPIVGMLCGAAVSGIVISTTYVLKEIYENRDKVEMLLAFGATRFEACKPIAKDALKFALTPTINQMSVIGIIAVPGTMTGAILGGASVEQAARLQMVLMFMLSSATSLSSFASTVFTLGIVMDQNHRIRTERIDSRKHAVWRARDRVIESTVEGIKTVWTRCMMIGRKAGSRDEFAEHIAEEERRPLSD